MRESQKRVVIQECGEPLVNMADACPQIFTNHNGRPIFVRQGVAERLLAAKNNLPTGMTFLVNSGWRSSVEQETEFERIFRSLKKNNPEWTIAEVREEANRFVAPSTGPNASGHLTGGAVDLVLADLKTGHKIPLTSPRLTFQQNAIFLDAGKLPKTLIVNRLLMFKALAKADFVGVSHEYWHWSYGDRIWAEKKRRSAIYGIIKSFNS